MEFEKKLKEIEEVMQKIESGEVNLDEAINLYSQAMKNCNECSKYLTQMKGKIEVINSQPSLDIENAETSEN